ncbi:hypothetical protein [Rhizobium leguminosarum]|uniref:hypothetical protein n=2 Tax=Rhizobium leguminosarum TaxID=384 RepID=UPI00103E96F0|nr:hypothetical protein [Rhizobium leguminosarum]TBZ14663.1 hypothetical protein E0H33_15170 [Rhizobium leguminosarum bv. viciae]
MLEKGRPFSDRQGAHLANVAGLTISSRNPRLGVEMKELSQYVFADTDLEILPPDSTNAVSETTSFCACCGHPATMDEDCYGICEEWLSP